MSKSMSEFGDDELSVSVWIFSWLFVVIVLSIQSFNLKMTLILQQKKNRYWIFSCRSADRCCAKLKLNSKSNKSKLEIQRFHDLISLRELFWLVSIWPPPMLHNSYNLIDITLIVLMWIDTEIICIINATMIRITLLIQNRIIDIVTVDIVTIIRVKYTILYLSLFIFWLSLNKG